MISWRETLGARIHALVGLALLTSALGACGDDLDDSTPIGDGGPVSEKDANTRDNTDTGKPDAGDDCAATTIRSLVRTYADWGWTDGAETYQAYRVAGEELGLEADCPKRLGQPADTVSVVSVDVVQDGAARVFEPANPACDADPRWGGSAITVTGCGFVSEIRNWEVEVYDGKTGCLVGVGRQIDGGRLVEGCSSPVFAGRFPIDCSDERVEVSCVLPDQDAGATGDQDAGQE